MRKAARGLGRRARALGQLTLVASLLASLAASTAARAGEPATLRSLRIVVAKPIRGGEVASLPPEASDALVQTTVDALSEHMGAPVEPEGPNVLSELFHGGIQGLPHTALKRAAKRSGHERFVAVRARFEHGGSRGDERVENGPLKGATRTAFLQTRVWIRVSVTDASGRELSAIDRTIHEFAGVETRGEWARLDHMFLTRDELQSFYGSALNEALEIAQ